MENKYTKTKNNQTVDGFSQVCDGEDFGGDKAAELMYEQITGIGHVSNPADKRPVKKGGSFRVYKGDR